MEEVACGMFGDLAYKVVVPPAAPSMGMLTVVAPAGTVTFAGTVNVALLPLVSAKVMPPVGAGAEMVRVSLSMTPMGTPKVAGRLAVTLTLKLRAPGAEAGAVAVIEPVPTRLPVTWGFDAGICRPPAMKTFEVTDALPLLEVS